MPLFKKAAQAVLAADGIRNGAAAAKSSPASASEVQAGDYLFRFRVQGASGLDHAECTPNSNVYVQIGRAGKGVQTGVTRRQSSMNGSAAW